MRVKLLRKLRRIGSGMVRIYSITKTDGVVTGMVYGYDSSEFGNLFRYGDTAEDVKRRAADVYISTNIERIRRRYGKGRK